MKTMRQIINALFAVILLMTVLLPGSAVVGRFTGQASPAYSPESTVIQSGPPWYNTDWQYRLPVTISNSGASLAYYQVLVTLNGSNFNFSHAKPDGSDLLVTHSDGITELHFWIELWDSANQLAYLWVRVPGIPTGSMNIYLYYGNPSASAASNGDLTFDFFDEDFCQFPGSGCSLNPIQYATQSWWEATTTYPMVFEDTTAPNGYRFHMLYDGHNVIGHAKGYAYSDDMLHWTSYDGGPPHPPNPNPIMGTGYAGGNPFAWGDTMWVNGVYQMFVSSGPGVTVLASSTDLVTWSGFLSLTLLGHSGGNIGTGAAVLKEGDGITPVVVDNKYWMVYYVGGSPGSIYLASSPVGGDLRTWTSSGSPIAAPTPGGWDQLGMWTPSFIRFGDYYYVYYQGQGPTGWDTGFIRSAATSGGSPIPPSFNPANWSKSDPDNNGTPDPVLRRGPSGSWDYTYAIDPMVRQFSDGVYYLFYTGNVANGYAYANSPEGPWIKPGGGSWTNIVGSPSVSGGVLSLPNNTGVRTSTTYQYQAVGFRANFGVGTGRAWAGFINGSTGPRAMIGDRTTDVDHLYLKNYVSAEANALLPGTWHGAFHTFEVQWDASHTSATVDHAVEVALISQVPNVALPVTLYSYTGNNATLQVDWVYVRQYRNPEPTALPGTEQTTLDLSLDKAEAYRPGNVYAGDLLTYTLTITNTSWITAPAVIVTDTLPAEVILASASSSLGECSQSSPVVCDIGELPGGETVAVTLQVTTTIDGVLANFAQVNSAAYDVFPTNNTDLVITTVYPVAELSASLVDAPDPLRVGELLVYTATVQNNGPSLADTLLLTDSLPASLDLQFANAGQGSCTQTNPVICDLGQLAAGAEVEVYIGAIPLTDGVITNTVNTGSAVYERDHSDNTATVSTTVTPVADLYLEVGAQPDPVLAGELLTYTLTISNPGPSTAVSIELVDDLPGELTFLSSVPGEPDCQFSAGQLTCSLGNLSAGNSIHVSVLGQVSSSASGVLESNAVVTSPTYDPDTGNNFASINTQVDTAADLAVQITDQPEVLRDGQPLTYTIWITNSGPSDALAVSLVDDLPLGVTFEGTDPPICSLVSGNVYCPLDTLPGGASTQVLIFVTVDAGTSGILYNQAQVTSASTNDPYPANNSATETTIIDTQPPVATWVAPVGNEGTYFVQGEVVTLEASATDNTGIAYVHFFWWDHVNNVWVDIGMDYTAPYQWEFDTSVLYANTLNQVFAIAYDLAGNPSPPVRILLYRIPAGTYLPFLVK